MAWTTPSFNESTRDTSVRQRGEGTDERVAYTEVWKAISPASPSLTPSRPLSPSPPSLSLSLSLDERLHGQSFELVDMLTSVLGWLYAFNCFYKYTLSIVNEHGEPLPVEAQLRESRRSSEAQRRQ